MREKSEGSWMEADFGFGQAVALLMWVPADAALFRVSLAAVALDKVVLPLVPQVDGSN